MTFVPGFSCFYSHFQLTSQTKFPYRWSCVFFYIACLVKMNLMHYLHRSINVYLLFFDSKHFRYYRYFICRSSHTTICLQRELAVFTVFAKVVHFGLRIFSLRASLAATGSYLVCNFLARASDTDRYSKLFHCKLSVFETDEIEILIF